MANDLIAIEDPTYVEVDGEGKRILVQLNQAFTYNGEAVSDFFRNGRLELNGIGAAWKFEPKEQGDSWTPIIVAWISYRFPKKAKEQTDQIISELSEVKKQIKDVQETADDNNTKIDQVQAKLKLHDDAHLVTMRVRLDRDIRRALRRGFTTRDEFYGVDSMRIS